MKELDPIKHKIDWMLRTFNIFYRKKKAQNIHNYLTNMENPVTKVVMKILDEITSNIKDHKYYRHNKYNDHERYRRILRNPVEFGLFLYNNDSAWHDIAVFIMWRFKEELLHNKELQMWLDNEVKKPDFWYYNIWEDFQQKTKDLQKKGEILDHQLSEEEHYFVDNTQLARHEKFIKDNIKKREKYQHW